MQPNFANYYENCEPPQRKPLMHPNFHQPPHPNQNMSFDSYYQRPQNTMNMQQNMPFSNDNSYYENVPKFPPPQNIQTMAPPMYSSYNPSPMINHNNVVSNGPPPQNIPAGGYNNYIGNPIPMMHNTPSIPPPREKEDVSFFLQSFQNYFQEQGSKTNKNFI